jgi:hypothetical protein
LNDIGFENKKGFTVYPNPANSEIIVELNNATSQRLSIINNIGQIVLQKEVGKMQKIDIQLLEAGLYFVKIGNGMEKLMILR